MFISPGTAYHRGLLKGGWLITMAGTENLIPFHYYHEPVFPNEGATNLLGSICPENKV
jgi:hypothetical protein